MSSAMAWFSMVMRGRRVVKKGSAMAWQGIALAMAKQSAVEFGRGIAPLCRVTQWQGVVEFGNGMV